MHSRQVTVRLATVTSDAHSGCRVSCRLSHAVPMIEPRVEHAMLCPGCVINEGIVMISMAQPEACSSLQYDAAGWLSA